MQRMEGEFVMASGCCKVPNFFIVGANKAGTTSLYEALRRHPQIYMSPNKEPHYFAKDIDSSRFFDGYRLGLRSYADLLKTDMTALVHNAHVTQWEDYLELFRNVRGEAAIGEASTFYLLSTCAAQAIRQTIPRARIIMVLRDPVERAFSAHLMHLRIGTVRRPFLEDLADDLRDSEEAWGYSRMYVKAGLYSDQVKRYLDAFPPEQVKVFLFEDMRRNWTGLLKELFEFLQVSSDFMPGVIRANEAAAPRLIGLNFLMHRSGLKRWISHAAPARLKRLGKRLFYTKENIPRPTGHERSMLIELFREDVKKLERLLDRDLSAWLT